MVTEAEHNISADFHCVLKLSTFDILKFIVGLSADEPVQIIYPSFISKKADR